MANIITAGNSTNGGTQIVTDTSGTLNIVTGSGSGSNAITIDGSQNVVFSGNVSGNIKSGTAVASTSGTSIDFTGIPSTVKRITVMLNEMSTNGVSNYLVQLGTGSTTFTTTGYVSTGNGYNQINVTAGINSTAGFVMYGSASVNAVSVLVTIVNVSGNTWMASHNGKINTTTVITGGGTIALAAALTAVRITTVNGIDAFDAGSINILYE
jgi:hypothetical protein